MGVKIRVRTPNLFEISCPQHSDYKAWRVATNLRRCCGVRQAPRNTQAPA